MVIVGKTFSKNIHDIFSLLCLPHLLVWVGQEEVSKTAFVSGALLKSTETQTHSDREAIAEVEHMWHVLREVENKKTKERAKKKMLLLLEQDLVQAGMQSLLYAAMCSAWTAFECLATDTWISAVNAKALILGQRIFDYEPQDRSIDGLLGKRIEVGILARYGYDLRNCLGTLLAPKFDFTDIISIQKAFEVAFGRSKVISAAFENQKVKLLQINRNLILHRGGIIDPEYLRRTQLPLVAGEQLKVDLTLISELVNEMIKSGCSLLHFVDDWMAKHS